MWCLLNWNPLIKLISIYCQLTAHRRFLPFTLQACLCLPSFEKNPLSIRIAWKITRQCPILAVLFKISVLTSKTLHEKQPVYPLQMLAAALPSHSARSNKGISLSVPRVKTNTGAWAFYSCAPSLWNNHLLSVYSTILVSTFKKHPKTHLFDLLACAPKHGTLSYLLHLWTVM